MQTTKASKPASKWHILWSRLTRRTPFWKRRPVESDDDSSVGGLVGGVAADLLGFIRVVVTGGLMVTFLIMVVIGPIFLSPDFMRLGLADPIGRALAGVCLATGRCDIQYLLGGAASAVMILLLIVMVGLRQSPAEIVDDNDTIATVLEATGALDERIVHLRADLVLAGVLPLSADEKVDGEVGVPYARPELTDQQQRAAAHLAVGLIGHKSTADIRQAVAGLLAENQRLPLSADEKVDGEVGVPYARPELTDQQQRAAAHLAVDLIGHKSTADIRQAVAGLLAENQRLALEVNAHRQARGYELLPTVQVN